MRPDIALPVQSSRMAWPGTAILALGSAYAIVLGVFFWPGISAAVLSWSREEYSYGYIVPFVALFLFMRGLPAALAAPSRGAWVGIAVLGLAIALGGLGRLSRIESFSGYGLILAISAGVIAALGFRAAVRLWPAQAYLFFMLPLPQVIYLKLSGSMQRLSSELGVGIVRLLEIPVLLEGNIIDLGTFKLQVAEACSGLRYLFPLLSFGFLFAVLYRGPAWQRGVLFLSAIPIAIVMNSLRIAVIAVLVANYGTGSAEGFLHLFEGWVVFLGCVAILFAEAFLLKRLSGRGDGPLSNAFDFSVPPLRPSSAAALSSLRSVPLLAATMLVITGFAAVQAITPEARSEVIARRSLDQFDLTLGGWRGMPEVLQPEIVSVLGADDYAYLNYTNADAQRPINLFIAYYNDQRDGRAVHSPEICLPGDGWEIASLSTVVFTAPGAGGAFKLNRALVQKGLARSLVYYWFEQRGRRVTGEYEAKWLILKDGITRNRTDGALVRVVTGLAGGESEASADRRLEQYLGPLVPRLAAFVPP